MYHDVLRRTAGIMYHDVCFVLKKSGDWVQVWNEVLTKEEEFTAETKSNQSHKLKG